MSQLPAEIPVEAPEEAAPYVVALTDGAAETAVALCSSGAVAYAAFYAAAREHFGRSLRLRRGNRVLVDSRLQ